MKGEIEGLKVLTTDLTAETDQSCFHKTNMGNMKNTGQRTSDIHNTGCFSSFVIVPGPTELRNIAKIDSPIAWQAVNECPSI